LASRTRRKNRRPRRPVNVTPMSKFGSISLWSMSLQTHGSSSRSSKLYGRKSLNVTTPYSPLTCPPNRIERTSDLRYLQQLRHANAERVAAWNQLTVQLPARIPASPLRRWGPKQKQKSLPPTPTTAAFPPIPPLPTDTPLHYLSNCALRTPASAWSSSNNVHSSFSSTHNLDKAERRKSGSSLKPLKTLWRRMKSQSNLKAA
jgi:hypothetical protein